MFRAAEIRMICHVNQTSTALYAILQLLYNMQALNNCCGRRPWRRDRDEKFLSPTPHIREGFPFRGRIRTPSKYGIGLHLLFRSVLINL